MLYRARQYHCHALCKISEWLDNWDKCYLWTRFEFKMIFGWISYIAQHSSFSNQAINKHIAVYEVKLVFPSFPQLSWFLITFQSADDVFPNDEQNL